MIDFQLWRIQEFFYRIMTRIYLFLGKGIYWIDCGYCVRDKGNLKCVAPGPVPMDKLCYGCVFERPEKFGFEQREE
jgi:hypothetical protein